MKAAQLAMVEKQYVQKRLLEEFAIPRLSLFLLVLERAGQIARHSRTDGAA